MKVESQCTKILNALKNGVKVTTLWGFNNGILRVSARIGELRQKHNISDRWIKKNGEKWKEYYLAKN